ncbi:hypothetical protein E2C01_066948 [Portunus trituberculatus]|uniref:PiggyBac transposable element-derived protein domain-containing protein n=1 Tax=Portunus trituberculatus TaxID=210409 RepID=A0A5B7HS49_PORTR|nr:hypothetical protein [Portunus trituberculatus]
MYEEAWVKGQDISVLFLPPYEHPKPVMILATMEYFNLYKTPMMVRRYYLSLFGYVVDITMCNAWLLYKRDCKVLETTNMPLKDYSLNVSKSLRCKCLDLIHAP